MSTVDTLKKNSIVIVKMELFKIHNQILKSSAYELIAKQGHMKCRPIKISLDILLDFSYIYPNTINATFWIRI